MTQHYTQCNLHWSSFWLLCVLWVRTNIMAGIHLCSIIHSSFTNLKTLSHIPFQTKSAQPLWGCRLVNSKVASMLKLFSFPLLLRVDSQSSTYRTKNSWWLWPLFFNSPTSQHIQFLVLPHAFITSKLARQKSSQKLLFIGIKVKVESKMSFETLLNTTIGTSTHPLLPPSLGEIPPATSKL